MFFNKNYSHLATTEINEDQIPPITPEKPELNLLYQFNLAMLDGIENEPCEKMVKLIGEYTNATVCSLWLVEPGETIQKLRKGFFQVETKLLQNISSLDFELVEHIISLKGHQMISNGAKLGESFIDGRIQALGLPILLHNEIVGVINIWKIDEKENIFTDEIINTLYKITNLIGLGIKNQLLDKKHQIRIRKELEIAQRIQVNLVPKILPIIHGVSLGVRAISANEVGGDYLDLIITSNKNLGIVIGDVMGKGIPASLHMVMTRTLFRSVARNDLTPNLVLKEINSVLYPDLSPQGVFVTLFYGLYHPETKLLLYSNAAHNPPIIYHAKTGEYSLLKTKGTFIGGKEIYDYTLQSIQLTTGDIVVFYSDGLKEARNKSKEQFGVNRIVETVEKYAFYDAASITDCIYLSYAKFSNMCEQADDITFSVLKIE